MTSLLYRLGRGAVRRRRLVLLAWAVRRRRRARRRPARGGETSDAFDIPGVESQQAYDVLEADFPAAAGTSAQLVFAAETGDGTLADPAAAAAVDAALGRRRRPAPRRRGRRAAGSAPRRPHRLRRRPVRPARPRASAKTPSPRLEATAGRGRRHRRRADGAGRRPAHRGRAAEEPGGQEVIGILVAVVVLLVAFGSVIAMGLPIGTALVGLATSLGLITLMASFVDVNSVSPDPRRHDRPRRRHRLRAVHRHPPPREPARRA